MFKLIKRRIAMWFTVRKIGKWAKAYSKLSQQAERNAFLAEKFGRDGQSRLRW